MTETGEWAVRFKQLLFDNLKKDLSYDQASAAMRKIVRSKMLTHFDLHDNPERFFLAHRLLAEHAVALGPGNWIRFTVHYNLCVGSVLAVGSQEQVQSLQGMQDKGQLGCFGLTERFAGVNSVQNLPLPPSLLVIVFCNLPRFLFSPCIPRRLHSRL